MYPFITRGRPLTLVETGKPTLKAEEEGDTQSRLWTLPTFNYSRSSQFPGIFHSSERRYMYKYHMLR
jgi:hypothetical protein